MDVAKEAEFTRRRIKELNKQSALNRTERDRLIQEEKQSWWQRVKKYFERLE